MKLILIAKRIRHFRLQRSLTQEDLAQYIGISRQSIISLESGRSIPSLQVALQLAECLEIPFSFLFAMDTQRPTERLRQLTQAQKGGEHMAHDLVPWSPFAELKTIREALDELMDERFFASGHLPSPTTPHCNVIGDEKELRVEVALPGYAEDQIEVNLTTDSLTIKGERKSSEEVNKKNLLHQEFSREQFQRSVSLPDDVDCEKAQAELKDGVLTVTFPRRKPLAPKIKKVKVIKARSQ